MKWAWAVLIVIAIGSSGWFIARKNNPTRPLIGEPTAQHYEQFARRFNNLMVERGEPITEYAADLRRTDSVTSPLVGTFDCLIDRTPVKFYFAWRNGRWIEMEGRHQAIADEAQR